MTSNRFFVDKADIRLPHALLKGEDHHHLSRVARIRPGHTVWLFDREGADYRARVEKIETNQTHFMILEQSQTEPQKVNIILAQAVLKLKGMELLLQKSTELGTHSVVPILAARSVAKLENNLENKFERWLRIMREAAKQCGRSTIPGLRSPVTLKYWLEQPQDGRKFVLWEGAGKYLKEVFLSEPSDTSFKVAAGASVIILVGPEGGWTKREQKRYIGAWL